MAGSYLYQDPEAKCDYIADTLTGNKDKINHKTVGNYMQYLCNAFAFYRVRRYGIQGKKHLSSSDKLYLSDHTFRYAKLGTKNLDYGRVPENIVAIELLRRGYEVYVRILYKKEIDFIAIKRNEKLYMVSITGLFNPVSIDGTLVSRAYLHNHDISAHFSLASEMRSVCTRQT